METPRAALHDLSSRPRRLQISVDPAVTYDLLLVLWAALGVDDKASEHALGRDWFDEFRTSLSAETRELAARVSPFGVLWPAMLGVVEGAPGPHDLDSVLGWLEDQDPAWLRERLMSEQFCDFDQSLVAAASGGNPEAVEQLLADPQMDHKEPHFKDALRQSFALDSTETVSGLIEVLGRARSEGFGPFEKEWTSALERDAVDKRIAVASASSPRELVETVSNGISYEIPPGVRRLVIVPSVSLRPWTLITDFGDGLLVCCPVSEEALNSDPEAPPAWLVATYRALGDEKRLRLLRRLADGPASLAELTEHMGMAKSTVFHHIGVLRAAGLVRVLLGPDKESTNYSLRTDSIPDRDSLIDLYLQPPRKEVKS